MKVEFHEYDGCFSIDLTAENVCEAAKLARFGMNSTKELRSHGTDVEKGSIGAFIVIGKRRNPSTTISQKR